MPVEPVLLLLLAAILGNVVVTAIIVVPAFFGRRGGFFPDDGASLGLRSTTAERDALTDGDAGDIHDDGAQLAAYDRLVRIVSWASILLVAVLLAVTGLWTDTRPAIFLLLAVGGGFVLVVHDLLPPGALGSARFVVEGSIAMAFITALVFLTGGAGSPFFYAYPLVVGGAALVASPPVTVVFLVVAAATFVASALAVPGGWPPAQTAIATIAIELIALILIVYVAMVVAGAQRRSRDAAVRLSTIDSLTGLFNRTFFFAAVEREIARSARSGRRFCLLMMDLDELKTVNDRYGHFVGDRVLLGVGEIIRNGVRRIDTAARYGGDEFVVLLPETDPTGAFVLAEKIRIGVAERPYHAPGREVRTTLSIGVVTYPDDGRTPDELMITADRAMYESKRLGKDRVIDYGSTRLAAPGGSGRSAM